VKKLNLGEKCYSDKGCLSGECGCTRKSRWGCRYGSKKCKVKTPPNEKLVKRYIGCFSDRNWKWPGKRDLPKYFGGRMSSERCLQKCMKAGYKYMGRQWSNECWCGNSYGSKGKTSGCKGCLSHYSRYHNYGGDKNCVFNVDMNKPTPSVAPSTSPVASPLSQPTSVRKRENFRFTLN